MPKNPPDGYQRVIPYLSYADAPAAIAFLTEAFGFEERIRFPMPDGRIGHAELQLGEHALLLASAYPEMGMASPKGLDAVHAQVLVYVDDVDAHFARAKAAGATIATEPEDQPHGDRSYRAVDPEGHRFIFATHVRDVDLSALARSGDPMDA
ncbi:MAG: VOC family protein [Sandaracinaceae bacterium]